MGVPRMEKQKRSKYLTRAKELSAQLKTRDVEQKQSAR